MPKKSAFFLLFFPTLLSSCVKSSSSDLYAKSGLNLGSANIPAAADASIGNFSSTPEKLQLSQPNTNEFVEKEENDFLTPIDQPFSTFSIDVDTASYSMVRRFLESGSRPPKGTVRLEELLNYFEYSYPEPSAKRAVQPSFEVSSCPWAPSHRLLLVGLRAKSLNTEKAPPSNLVFLIDTSGSMSSEDRLPLVQKSLLKLTDSLRPQDRVAIVTYAGSAGLVLDSTSGSEKEKIRAAVQHLSAGGSTAGGEGIRLAYQTAKQHFLADGNNRIILATDGDFNVGVSSTADLEALITSKRNENIFLSVLGFGMGNYKDGRLETLADKGNGNYAYIDRESEADRVFGKQLLGTIYTVAKDVKVQIEFNPRLVGSYRLLGYENRMLNTQDFANDKKDAGDMGAGQTVTAVYEIIPPTKPLTSSKLKYQTRSISPRTSRGEIATLHFRSKEPKSEKSEEFHFPILNSQASFERASDNMHWAAAVLEFGMKLKGSSYAGTASIADIENWAKKHPKAETEESRKEFLRLLKMLPETTSPSS